MYYFKRYYFIEIIEHFTMIYPKSYISIDLDGVKHLF